MAMRREVLKAFKSLHRVRQKVFEGDDAALLAAKIKINEEFKASAGVTDDEIIKQKVKLAFDVAEELEKNVIQAVEKKPGVYEAKIRDETTRLENYPFDPNAKIPPPRKRGCKP